MFYFFKLKTWSILARNTQFIKISLKNNRQHLFEIPLVFQYFVWFSLLFQSVQNFLTFPWLEMPSHFSRFCSPSENPEYMKQHVVARWRRRAWCLDTCGFILKKIQWHIHAGSPSLVNCWREALTRHYIRCSWILLRAAVSLMDDLSLDGDRCIRVIPRHMSQCEEIYMKDTFHHWKQYRCDQHSRYSLSVK